MAEIIKEITLDVSKYNDFVNVLLQQGESITRKLGITITENDEEYSIPTDAITRINIDKLDGSFIDDLANVVNNKVMVTITPAMSQVAKRLPAQIIITDVNTGGTLKSIKFHFMVEESAMNESMIVSVSEFTTLTNAILNINDISVAENSRQTAETTRGGNEATRISNENTRITNENTRITNEDIRLERDAVRPVWTPLTQAAYDALTQQEKDDPYVLYKITDDDGVLPTQLQDLIARTESVVINRAGINDNTPTLSEAYSGNKTQKMFDDVASDLASKASQDALSIQQLRIDSFVAVASTTDNVETTDIRIGTNGVLYSSAGEGVRGQVDYFETLTDNTVYNGITSTSNVISAGEVFWVNYYNPIISEKITLWLKTITGHTNTEVKIVFAKKEYDGKLTVYNTIITNFTGLFLTLKANISYKNTIIGVVGKLNYDNTGSIQLVKNTYSTLTTSYTPTVVAGYGIVYNAKIFSRYDMSKKMYSKYILTVSPYGDKMFTTINDAFEYAKAIESKTTPVTIKIYPGTYKEVVNIKGGHYISVIGTNPKDCIIRDDTGNYLNAPLRIQGDCVVKNITCIATHNDTPNFESNTTDDYKIGSYALHMDDDNTDIISNHLCLVENCIFYSEQNASVGIGMQQNTKIIFKNCEMTKNMPDSMYTNYPSQSDKGAFLIHKKEGLASPSSQHCILDSCRLRVNKGNVMLLSPFSESIDGMKMSFYNNMLWSDTKGKTNVILTYGIGYEVFEDSYGNNVIELNA